MANAMLGGARKRVKSRPAIRGVILYKGPSVLDGVDLVCVATFSSQNAKTGDMIQTFILLTENDPVSASTLKLDGSICGVCPHRQSIGGACYVNIGQAPLAVYRGFQRGIYPVYDPDQHANLFTGRMLRMGSYGDPAAVPFEAWEPVLNVVRGNTGYTHQASHTTFDKRFLEHVMVSADSPKQALKFQAQGAKTFRVAMIGDSLADDEIECLSDSQGIQCIECGICNGQTKNVAITVHGSRKNNFRTALIPVVEVA
jgi:hypothetical protein